MKTSTARSLAHALGMDEYNPPDPVANVAVADAVHHNSDNKALPATMPRPPPPPLPPTQSVVVAEDFAVDELEEDGEALDLGAELAGSSVFTPHELESAGSGQEDAHVVDTGAMEAFRELQKVHREALVRIEELEQQHKELTAELEDANKKLAEKSDESDYFAQQNKDLRKQLDQLRDRLATQDQATEDRASTLEHSIAQLQEQDEASQQALNSARQEISTLENRLRSQAAELEGLKNSEQQLQQQVHELTAQLRNEQSATQGELLSLDEKLARANAEGTMLRRRKAELEVQVDQLMNDNNRLQLQLQNSDILRHQMQRNQEVRYSMPDMNIAMPPPPPPSQAQLHYPTIAHEAYGGYGREAQRPDPYMADNSLSRSVDRMPARMAPAASSRPSTADPRSSHFAPLPHEMSAPPTSSSSRGPRSLADVAGASLSTSLSFPSEQESVPGVRGSHSFHRRQAQQQERSPFATSDTAHELAAFEDLERQLTSLQLEKQSLDAEYSKLYPRATKTLQDKVRIKRIEARVEEIGRETSELRRQLAKKPA